MTRTPDGAQTRGCLSWKIIWYKKSWADLVTVGVFCIGISGLGLEYKCAICTRNYELEWYDSMRAQVQARPRIKESPFFPFWVKDPLIVWPLRITNSESPENLQCMLSVILKIGRNNGASLNGNMCELKQLRKIMVNIAHEWEWFRYSKFRMHIFEDIQEYVWRRHDF